MVVQEEVFMKILDATEYGDVSLLNDIFFKKKQADIFYTSIKEKWNWLHLCNLNSYAPAALSSVEFYIQHRVPINAQDMYGMTPLHYAMRAKNVDGAIALLNAGADPNIPNRDNLIPLRMCLRYPDRLDLLELMLKKGGNVHYFDGSDYLLEAWKDFRGNEPGYQKFFELLEQYA